ncbi:NAD-dependent protein deacetylase sirtuin-2, partial [Mortierella sp. AD011]
MSAPRASVKSRPTRIQGEAEPRVPVLKDASLESVADFINQGKAKNIIVMSGAGISTAAGIKDFRTPGTGLYDDLKRFNLPYPQAVFDISFFKPTLTHYFLPLLAKKGLLLRSYTQNIDMLERLTGLDPDLLVESHGSFATSKCIECDIMVDSDIVKKHILKSEIPYCKECRGLVKPTITFFGEELPPRFGALAMVDFKKCDLLIVLGTSLQVEPFNRLITRVPESCPRLLINRERAGEDIYGGFDFNGKWKYPNVRDALFLGSCDEGARKLAKLCGWEDELQAMYEAGNIKMQEAEELEALTLAEEEEKAGNNAKGGSKDTKDTKDTKSAKSAKDIKDTKDSDDLDGLTERFQATNLSTTEKADAKKDSKETPSKVATKTESKIKNSDPSGK